MHMKSYDMPTYIRTHGNYHISPYHFQQFCSGWPWFPNFPAWASLTWSWRTGTWGESFLVVGQNGAIDTVIDFRRSKFSCHLNILQIDIRNIYASNMAFWMHHPTAMFGWGFWDRSLPCSWSHWGNIQAGWSAALIFHAFANALPHISPGWSRQIGMQRMLGLSKWWTQQWSFEKPRSEVQDWDHAW